MEKEKIVAITAEYNPFHAGHAWQIQEIRRQLGRETPIIAMMSGSATQRGELALTDKWTRARLALAGGADLVLELPVTGVLRSADHFAAAAVSVLKGTGIVTHLSFGMETADLALLEQLAAESIDANTIKATLARGASYAEALCQALTERDSQYGMLLSGSNNLLALSYAKAVSRAACPVRLLPIQRSGNDYNENVLSEKTASASAIRSSLETGGLSEEILAQLAEAERPLAARVLKNIPFREKKERFNLLLAALLETTSPEKMAATAEVSEGLEARIYKLRRTGDFYTLAEKAAGKRYSPSRIRRLLLQLLLCGDSLSFRNLSDEAAYLRILGFNDKGQSLIRRMKKEASLPLFPIIEKNTTASLTEEGAAKLTLDRRAANLLELTMTGAITDRDFRQPPVRE